MIGDKLLFYMLFVSSGLVCLSRSAHLTNPRHSSHCKPEKDLQMTTEQLRERLREINREAQDIRAQAEPQGEFTPEQSSRVKHLLTEAETLKIQLEIDGMNEPAGQRIPPPQPVNHAGQSRRRPAG